MSSFIDIFPFIVWSSPLPSNELLMSGNVKWDLSLIFFVGKLRHCPCLLWDSFAAGSKQQVAEGESGQIGSLRKTVSGSPGERSDIAFSHTSGRKLVLLGEECGGSLLLEVMLKELWQDSELWKANCECMLVWPKLQEALSSCGTCWRTNENLPLFKIYV